VVELLVYYLLMQVDFMETYAWAVSMVYERVPSDWLANELFSLFLADTMICGVPCLAILGSGAKGIISFMLIKLLNSRLVSVMGPEADPQYTTQTKFGGRGISIAYFCAVTVLILNNELYKIQLIEKDSNQF
jgi:hypothetical protein